MLIIRNKSHLPETCHGSVIALGNFDGIHLGHQAVIAEAVSLAAELRKLASVMTFEPHPRRVFKPDLPTLRIIPFADKARLLGELKVDFMRVIRFTRAFAATTAESFIKDILLNELHISHVVTGDDFIFGHNRAGNTAYMKAMAEKLHFGYTVCSKIMVDGERCSSTHIRQLLAQGSVDEAARFLGRPYSITAIVRSGDRRGRQLGFPTANLLPGRIFTAANGVYAVEAHIRGKTVPGVANLGVRPTFGHNRLLLEVHLFDWHEDIYGEHMGVVFRKYIRPEKKFNGIEALKMQISQDCRDARNILALGEDGKRT